MAGGQRITFKAASHHKPVLPCHTLERNFRKRARFLDSCGGTEWTVRKSLTRRQIQQHTAKTEAATFIEHCIYTLLKIRSKNTSFSKTQTRSQSVKRFELKDKSDGTNVMTQRQAATICDPDWCLTPVKALISSSV